VAELLVREIEQWSYDGGERAWRSNGDGVAMSASLCSSVGEREQGARAKWSEQQRCAPYLSVLA